MNNITDKTLSAYKEYLEIEEKSPATVGKYLHDIISFSEWLANKELTKKSVLEYKEYLKQVYSVSSVNSIISSLNSFFEFAKIPSLHIKTLKTQKQIFMKNEKELTKQEYERLLQAAKSKGNERLYLLMQTICSTGIRVSELKFITVEAVENETAEIFCKGKTRSVFLPKDLCRLLLKYAKRRKIISGPVFVTKTGTPLNRSNIWSDMKKLCQSAGVSKSKVFPHNLRHLFARTYYSVRKDIIRLADILGHSSVNTTRIYTMETGDVHRKQIQRLGLLLC